MTFDKINPNVEKILNSKSKFIYVSGAAGTGKSFTLNYLRSELRNKEDINFCVVAPTGVAAVNINGFTIHSLFKIFHTKQPKFLKKINYIIIDEISMVSASLFDRINEIMQNKRGSKDFFGGATVVVFGDLGQLPPVDKCEDHESPYFFSAKCYIQPEVIQLTEVKRQNDKRFIDILHKIRNGTVAKEDLDILNRNVGKNLRDPIYIATTNKIVENINNQSIVRLNTKPVTFFAEFSPRFQDRPAPETLTLKKGTRVMYLKNENGLCNGDLGVVKKIFADKKEVEVAFDRGITQIVKPSTWVSEEDDVYIQLPLVQAYAITIHKSQGKTFEKAIIDKGNGTWEHGQMYTALSRVKSLDGLSLKKPLELSDFIYDPVIIDNNSLF